MTTSATFYVYSLLGSFCRFGDAFVFFGDFYEDLIKLTVFFACVVLIVLSLIAEKVADIYDV